MSTDLFDTPMVTRSDAFVASAADGQPVVIRPCHSGIDVQDARVGLWAIPQADGRLGFQVIGLPSRTGFGDDCSLLQSDARHDYAPGDVRIDGNRLVCLRPNDTEPLLQEGFVLSLSPAMAAALTAWLPRLVRVAERAHQVAIAVAAHLAPAYSDNGIDVCAALVSKILLDGYSVEDARRIVGDVHWTLERPEWRNAVDAPDVRELLHAAARDVNGAALPGMSGRAGDKMQEPASGPEAVIEIWNRRARDFGFEGVAGLLNSMRHGDRGSPDATPAPGAVARAPAGAGPGGA